MRNLRFGDLVTIYYHNLQELAPATVASLRAEARELRWLLYRTPKWRKIKRYRLFERIDKLEEDAGLIEHVFLLDE